MAAASSSPFPSSTDWPADSDLVAVSDWADAGLVLAAYRAGVFPMPLPDDPDQHEADLMGWWSPVERAILPLDGLRVTRSLRRSATRYRTTVDTAFEAVVERCADPRREYGWIDGRIRRLYGELHALGAAHSVECWTADGRLAGGLYGVGLGGLFAGESMFHDPEIGRDASKVALVALVERLAGDGRLRLLDVQWHTEHLASLGAVQVGRARYLERLADALALPAPDWSV